MTCGRITFMFDAQVCLFNDLLFVIKFPSCSSQAKQYFIALAGVMYLALLFVPMVLRQVRQALYEDLSGIGQALMVMTQPIVNFSHCSLHEVGFIYCCCLCVVGFLSLAQLPA